MAKTGWRILKRYLPDQYKSWLRSLMPKTRDRVLTYLFLSRIDWSLTKAFSIGYFGDIRINVKGREPQGTVNPGAEYEGLREELIAKLEAMKDPDTGEKMVEKVYKREDLYRGSQVHKTSDLIIKWNDYQYKSRINLEIDDKVSASRIMIDPSKDSKMSSIHRLYGVFMAYGKDIKQGVKLQGAHIMDLAPTVLYLLNEPIPDCMDGKVLTTIFREDFLSNNPIHYRKTEQDDTWQQGVIYSDEEAEKIRKRLQGLGYIE
jgi:predicted AlkP superfamily phosphohydrolase/phosphomutase